ncbi:hypothetical protein WN51_04446 [Melipona quadrifasciata]|uniref:Uncharacterized protein n=1 Tax=Melipona quadrifasciata TaxID=166423 RepID=A0A0N0U3Q4_9HYME|nr:hypothetical protein WN51_04446 [Melipona quadrifasciata]
MFHLSVYVCRASSSQLSKGRNSYDQYQDRSPRLVPRIVDSFTALHFKAVPCPLQMLVGKKRRKEEGRKARGSTREEFQQGSSDGLQPRLLPATGLREQDAHGSPFQQTIRYVRPAGPQDHGFVYLSSRVMQTVAIVIPLLIMHLTTEKLPIPIGPSSPRVGKIAQKEVVITSSDHFSKLQHAEEKKINKIKSGNVWLKRQGVQIKTWFRTICDETKEEKMTQCIR